MPHRPGHTSPTVPKPPKRKQPSYTADRGIPGSYEGETVTRRRLFEGGALAAGGIASAAFGLPALGFALGPVFEENLPESYQDVGPESDFDAADYISKIIDIQPDVGEAGKATVYIRKADGRSVGEREGDPPYVAVTNRCMHVGCPVRYVRASKRFICPCHGGVYEFDGSVAGGPPVRPLDRFYTRVENGRVLVGPRFSLNSELERFSPRDPSNHLDGLWQYLYPSRPTT